MLIPVVGVLLAIYLIYKGIEIYMLASLNTGDGRGRNLLVGKIALVASVVIALFSIYTIYASVTSPPTVDQGGGAPGPPPGADPGQPAPQQPPGGGDLPEDHPPMQ